MLFGVSTSSLYPMHTEKALLCLAENGIKNIEIFINSNLELHSTIFKSILDTILNYDLNILSVHPLPVLENLYLFSDYNRRKQEYMDICKMYFEKMQMLGAGIFVLHGAGNNHSCKNNLYFERYAELYETGKKFGVTVAQENVYYCKSGSLDFLSEMSGVLGNDVRFVLDLKQAVRAGYSCFDILDRIGDKVVHIHTSDSGKAGDCLPVGKGEFDFKKLFSVLKKLKYEKGFLLELYRENYIEESELVQSVLDLQKIYYNI